jgi:hypothetical protein
MLIVLVCAVFALAAVLFTLLVDAATQPSPYEYALRDVFDKALVRLRRKVIEPLWRMERANYNRLMAMDADAAWEQWEDWFQDDGQTSNGLPVL